ncbi:MAG: glycosyl transferase family 2 [Nitrospira sp.]|jgi:SAM-dependent methyltransferase|nr:glycosyl transferase family 2 [Nitrospira sp.]
MSTESGLRAEFEKVFQEREDPWRYTSPYEQTKYQRTLALIPEGIEAALEIGCAEGHFTVQLAPRVKTLTACDIAETALQRAAPRCAMFPHVRFARLDLVSEPLPGPVDLVICSEMLYFVGSIERLRNVAKKIGHALNHNGYLVMAHMNLLVDDPHQSGFDFQLPFGARVIGDVFQRSSHFRLLKEIRTPLYRIHLFQRISFLQRWLIHRKSETILLNVEEANLEPDVASHVHWKS